MKILIVSSLCLALLALYAFRKQRSVQHAQRVEQTTSNFYDLSYIDIEGKEVKMSSYKGKYILIVNVASKCGYTPQYADLEKLYESKKEDLVIIGFPCNQFLSQEPGTESEISDFCQKNYGVTFPLASKIDVKGKNQHPLYTWLTSKPLNTVEDTEVKWNFHKFLIGPDGQYIEDFASKVNPLDATLVDRISKK